MVQVPALHAGPIQATPRDGTRGRPGPSAPPPQVVSPRTGALTSSRAAHEARVVPPRGCSLATTERDERLCPPQELLAGSPGQAQAERGGRFLHDPRCVASALSVQNPARIMAFRMVMPVCLLVAAA